MAHYIKMAIIHLWSLLLLATSVFGAYVAPVIEDPIAFKNATWAKCQKQENAPDDAMKDFYYFRSAEGLKDYKCVAKCIQMEYGFFDKNGVVRKNFIIKTTKSLWKDPEVQRKLIDLTEECIKPATPGAHPCQSNYNLLECFIRGIKERKINVGRKTK